MSKILFIIAPNDFQDNEYQIPKKVLSDAGHQVITASRGVVQAKGALGKKTKVDKDITQLDPDNYDGAVFIGGGGASTYFNDDNALFITQKLNEQGKTLGAICIAPSILANAGVLKDKKATSFPTEKSNIINQGANFSEKDVVVDENIVTASGPHAAKDFAQEILKLLP